MARNTLVGLGAVVVIVAATALFVPAVEKLYQLRVRKLYGPALSKFGSKTKPTETQAWIIPL